MNEAGSIDMVKQQAHNLTVKIVEEMWNCSSPSGKVKVLLPIIEGYFDTISMANKDVEDRNNRIEYLQAKLAIAEGLVGYELADELEDRYEKLTKKSVDE